MANYAKSYRRHFDKMNFGRNIKVPDLILSTLLLSKTRYWFKTFFIRKIGIIFF